LAGRGLDARALAGVTLVAVGPKTGEEMTAYGVTPDMLPADYRAEGVVEMLRGKVGGKTVLYPKAELARDVIPQQLAAAGATVVDPVAYRSVVPASAAATLAEALAGGIDLLTFSASSTVNNLIALLDGERQRAALNIPVASIGPLTSKTAKAAGFEVVVEPVESTLDALVTGISAYFVNHESEANSKEF